MMKRVAQITSDLSSAEIANSADVLKEIGECVHETEHQMFIRLIRFDLGQVMRDITLKHNFKNIQERSSVLTKRILLINVPTIRRHEFWLQSLFPENF